MKPSGVLDYTHMRGVDYCELYIPKCLCGVQGSGSGKFLQVSIVNSYVLYVFENYTIKGLYLTRSSGSVLLNPNA